jgi:hypothetical protein
MWGRSDWAFLLFILLICWGTIAVGVLQLVMPDKLPLVLVTPAGERGWGQPASAALLVQTEDGIFYFLASGHVVAAWLCQDALYSCWHA